MKLSLKSSGQNVAANLIKPKKLKIKNPALIFVHGWKSNQQGNIKRAQEISKSGFICLTLDLKGHGESDGSIGQFSRADHLEDIKSAYGFLLSQKEIDPERIGIIGSSYGGYLSSVSVNDFKFHWLILRVPALYFDRNFDVPTEKLIGEDETGRAFKSTDLTPAESLALKGVAGFTGKILIIESENDEIIPHPVIENYLKYTDSKKLTYKVMKNTRHSLQTEDQEKEYIDILKKFLS